MRREGNMSKLNKKQNSRKRTEKKMEASNLSDAEFKALLLTVLDELR